jgi:hypothetical protein
MSSSMVSDVGQSNTLYLSIANGNIVQKVKEDNKDERVRVREYEDDKGNIKYTYEIPFRDLTGYITSIKIEKGKFGTDCRVHLALGDEKVIFTIPYESNYFQDFAKRIAGADLTKTVTLNAYSFENDQGKNIRGVTVQQGGEKLTDFFWDGKKALHGMPSVSKADAKKYDTDDWKIHFAQVRKFLKDVVSNLEFSQHNQLPEGKPSKMVSPDEAFESPEAPGAKMVEGAQKLPWVKE